METLDRHIENLIVLHVFGRALLDDWGFVEPQRSKMISIAMNFEQGSMPGEEEFFQAVDQRHNNSNIFRHDNRYGIVMTYPIISVAKKIWKDISGLSVRYFDTKYAKDVKKREDKVTTIEGYWDGIGREYAEYYKYYNSDLPSYWEEKYVLLIKLPESERALTPTHLKDASKAITLNVFGEKPRMDVSLEPGQNVLIDVILSSWNAFEPYSKTIEKIARFHSGKEIDTSAV